ncbi:MAG: arginine N-succinyltransferase [Phycisphaerales bacterium]|nr:arginine N-succinyltransferase [Phycisphaerales bacterium]
MFVIRQARVEDGTALLKLAKMVHFINLPADPSIINQKILRSRRSFLGKMSDEREREFMFILEDTETGNVVGTSGIVACISWPGRPHTYFQVRRREMYSKDLQTGQVHLTLQFGTDETGPTEMAGLILGPSYRGHKEKLGAILSLIRFHYMGLHRAWFADRVIAEMMGALTPASSNLLWEYLGRRFINLDYAEADRFCQHSKEFMTSLMPRDEIYASLLPPEARSLIGRVGPETEPAKAMLMRLGFRDIGHIDPFDGGPYLEAALDDISLVQQTRTAVLNGATGRYPNTGLVSFDGEAGFLAVRTPYADDDEGGIRVPKRALAAIGANVGDRVGLTPLSVATTTKRAPAAKRPRRKAPAKGSGRRASGATS